MDFFVGKNLESFASRLLVNEKDFAFFDDTPSRLEPEAEPGPASGSGSVLMESLIDLLRTSAPASRDLLTPEPMTVLVLMLTRTVFIYVLVEVRYPAYSSSGLAIM